MRCYTVLLACGWLLFTPPQSWFSELRKRVVAPVSITHGPPYSEVEVEKIKKLLAESEAFIKWVDDHPVPPLEKWHFRRGFDTAEACNLYAAKQLVMESKAHFELVQKLINPSNDENVRRMGEALRESGLNPYWLWAKCVPSDAIGFKLK